MSNLRIWHIWLGWLIAVPLLLWTASGLFMVANPIEKVRGEDLQAQLAPLPPIVPVAPMLEGRAVEELRLIRAGDAPMWIIAYKDGGRRRAAVTDGALLPPVSAVEAGEIATTMRAGGGTIAALRRSDADHPPLDLRRDRPAWQVAFDDGARFYIDADTGELLAVRTRLWRWFDLAWGLHIMDLEGREAINHPLLIGFAALALGGTLIGTVLMFRRRKRRPAPVAVS